MARVCDHALYVVKGLAGIIEQLGIRATLAALPKKAAISVKDSNPGFLLGHAIGDEWQESKPVWLKDVERRKHLYALGATGCGKTNLLLRLIEDDIDHGRTCVVFDLRGDLIDRLLLRMGEEPDQEVANRIHLIDLREDAYVAPFNPLAGSGDLYTRALHLLEVVRKSAESWGVQLEETLRNSLIALSAAEASLVEIERLLFDDDFRFAVSQNCPDQQVSSFLDRYGRLSAEKQQSWSLPVLNKISALLAIPQLRRMLSSPGGFEWSAHLDRPGQVVMIALAAHRFHGASHLLGGLLVSSLQGSIMSRASLPEYRRNPVSLYVDEFETMATSSFGTIIAEGRRFGLSLVLTHQNLTQLDPVLRQAIRNNVAVQLFFQTGSLDAAELVRELSKSDGKADLRQALIGQGVGEAFLARRGQESIRLATIHSPDPRTDERGLRDLKSRILDRCCLAVGKADRPRKKSGTVSPNPSQPEVRHDKRPTFKDI